MSKHSKRLRRIGRDVILGGDERHDVLAAADYMDAVTHALAEARMWLRAGVQYGLTAEQVARALQDSTVRKAKEAKG